MNDKVNVLLVDDQPDKLLAYEVILGDLGENLVKTQSARDALQFLLKNDVAVVLVDVCMPELDGLAVARKLCRAGCNTRIVLLTQIEDEDYITEARAIAYGYVFKRRLHTDLPLAVASAISGAFFLSR